MKILKEAGFEQVSFNDFSAHLEYYFQSMVDQINKHHDQMIAEGVQEAYLEKWLDSLTSRVEMQKQHKVFAWGIFAATKPGPVY